MWPQTERHLRRDVRGLWQDETYEVDRLYIWDYRGFGAFSITTGAIGLEGVDSIELLAQVARGIKEHGPAYAAYASAHEGDSRLLDNFATVYKGHHESLAAYVRQFFEPLKIEDLLKRAAPEGLQDYVCIDYEALGEEMLREGDVVTIPGEGGRVWVFDERTCSWFASRRVRRSGQRFVRPSGNRLCGRSGTAAPVFTTGGAVDLTGRMRWVSQ
ncbi:antirestriction protein ArdA [Nocardia sp. NPDC049149]|uniref:antirestriction protein ArdA n=1 Tax=Nocardia sp. NPDC049149 TaxID=3364315 RepID=UPI0037219FC3